MVGWVRLRRCCIIVAGWLFVLRWLDGFICFAACCWLAFCCVVCPFESCHPVSLFVSLFFFFLFSFESFYGSPPPTFFNEMTRAVTWLELPPSYLLVGWRSQATTRLTKARRAKRAEKPLTGRRGPAGGASGGSRSRRRRRQNLRYLASFCTRKVRQNGQAWHWFIYKKQLN